jgi:hypothetical protein
MNRRSLRRRLEFESLESMVLLSGPSAPEHSGVHALAVEKAKATHPIVLTGGAIGNYRSGHGFGAQSKITGLGSIEPFGLVSLSGTLLLNVPNPAGRLVISTGHGKVYVNVSGTSAQSLFSYSITHGTRKWTGVSGKGEVMITMVPVGSTGSSHGRVSLTFLSSATV